MTPEQVAATKAEFARLFIEAARRLGVTGNISYHAEGFRILNEERPQFPLSEAWGAWMVAGLEKQQEVVEKVVGVWARNPKVPERYAEARGKILPTVRTRFSQATRHLLEPLDGPVPKLPHAMLSEHLCAALTYPVEDGHLNVEQTEFERWGVTFERALEQACLNLAERSREGWRGSRELAGVWRSPWNDHLDVSRLLLRHVIYALPVKGDPVALATAPDCLLVTGSEDEQGLFNLARYARRSLETLHTYLFLRPVRLVRDVWEPWLPDQKSGAWAALHLLASVEHQSEVQFENVALARLFAHAGADVHPSVVELRTSPHELDVRTVAVWEAGRPNALARAEVLELRREGKTLAFLPWPAAEAAFGDRMPLIEGSYPARHKADDFPEDWQISGLTSLT